MLPLDISNAGAKFAFLRTNWIDMIQMQSQPADIYGQQTCTQIQTVPYASELGPVDSRNGIFGYLEFNRHNWLETVDWLSLYMADTRAFRMLLWQGHLHEISYTTCLYCLDRLLVLYEILYR